MQADHSWIARCIKCQRDLTIEKLYVEAHNRAVKHGRICKNDLEIFHVIRKKFVVIMANSVEPEDEPQTLADA